MTRRVWLSLVFVVVVAGESLAQSSTKTIPGSGTAGVPDPGCAANEIPARNPGNTAWICTTNVSGGAPTNVGYWVETADVGLSAERSLGALATGLVLNTTGVPSIYAGAACTNQFVRSLGAAGAAVCAAVSLTTDVTGTLPLANGGGLTTAIDDAVVVGNGTVLQSKVVPDCDDSAGQHLNYDNATNVWTCGTTTSAGAGLGDVVGPASSVDDGLVLFSGTGGKTLKAFPLGSGIPLVNARALVSVSPVSGSGAVVLQETPTILNPVIGPDWTNAQHFHTSGSQGSQLNASSVFNDGFTPVIHGGSGVGTATGTAGSIVLSVSPVLTGTPAAPTAAAETNSTQVASTAYVQTELGQSGWVGTTQLSNMGGVTPGAYTNINATVDADGRITAVTNGSVGITSPSGLDTQVQFNDAGALAGDSGLVFNKTTNNLTADGTVTSTTNATAGGALTLGEDTDLGVSTWKVDLAAVNLASSFSITPGTDGKLSGAGLLTAASTTPAELSTAAKSYKMCTTVAFTTALVDQFIAWAPVASTLTEFWCITTGVITTPPTIELDECTTAGASCTANSAGLTCDADGDSTTTFGGAAGSGIDADDLMQANMTGAVSVVGGMTLVCASYTPN